MGKPWCLLEGDRNIEELSLTYNCNPLRYNVNDLKGAHRDC